MALFQSYDKIVKWCNKKTAKRRKVVDMKLRSGRKTLNNSSLICEIQIPNKKSKENKIKHCPRIVKVVKKAKKGHDVLNTSNLSSRDKICELRTSSSNLAKSFSRNKISRQQLSRTSIPGQTKISDPGEVTIQPSTSLDNSVTCRVSRSSYLLATSTPNHSDSFGSCELRGQPSTSLHLPSSSTPNQVLNELSKTRQSNIKNLHCAGNSVNDNSKNNYYSLISDTSLTSLNIHCDTMSKNSTVADNTPLIVDVTNTVKSRSKKGKCSVLERILNQEPASSEQDARKTKSHKRKRSDSAKCSGEQTEKDDVCSVISVPSDDDDVVIIESVGTPNLKNKKQNINSDVPPSKRQKTSSELPVIDLCSPELPTNQHRRNYKEKKSNNIFQLCHGKKNIVKSTNKRLHLKESHCGIPSPKNMISQNALSKSRKALRQYMSILGTVAQRGPFPRSSATVISSSTSGDAAAKHEKNLPDAPSSSNYGNNTFNPKPTEQIGLRPIVIDGSNVAIGYANGAYFSSEGLKICIDYFLERDHKVLAFVPKFRKTHHATKDPHILDQLEKLGLVSFTPSRRIHGQLVVSYDDRYIVQYATDNGGIIVSTDNYHDIINENPAWKETIEKRLLMFTWAQGTLMFPQDPLGRYGPSLDQFLRFP